MDLLNATGMQAGYTMGMQPDGRELLVVVVKGTFRFPDRGYDPVLADKQLPLVEADTFTGEPGFSAPVYEADYAPRKPRCDVLLNGSVYAPGGKPTSRVQVGMKVGPIQKTFNVVADRRWEAGSAGIGRAYAGRFVTMPISYDRAFGGVDDFHKDKSFHSAYMLNPIGKGYHRELSGILVDGTPMPNTEEVGNSVVMPHQPYKPMAFGPIGRGWESRLKYAGTYDDDWLENTFPFLPPDFNEAYYQAAPPDQQMAYPKGGEKVILVNLTPEGRRAFYLPKVDVPVVFFRKKGDKHETHGITDTIVIEHDKGVFTMTWRASLPLKKNIFEIPQVLAGKMSRGWWRARELGKTWYPSLGHLAREKRREAAEAED
ncbi:MAG: DUF2169 domain-containing protein [Gammaproteobacteria bacterium]|nr:DUF2169 domain-containing protein [Gammaproteobacteria bacterium]